MLDFLEMATKFIKVLPNLLGLFASKDHYISNAELLVKYENYYPDKDNLANQIQSQINAKMYGNGQIVPSEYIVLAKSSKNPELILSLFPHVSNFLNYPVTGGVVLRDDLASDKDRIAFQKISSYIQVGAFVALVVLVATFLDNTQIGVINFNSFFEVTPQRILRTIFQLFWVFLTGALLVASFQVDRKLASLKRLIYSVHLLPTDNNKLEVAEKPTLPT